MRESLAIVLLCAVASVPILLGLADRLRHRRSRRRRETRRRANLGYQNAWKWVFGRARQRRLTDQSRRDES